MGRDRLFGRETQPQRIIEKLPVREGGLPMLDTTSYLFRHAHSNFATSAELFHRVSRLRGEISSTWDRIRRIIESRRPIAGAAEGVFEVRVEDFGEVCVVYVKGEIDLLTARELESTLSDVSEHVQLVVLSIREVDYLDCSAIHALERAHARFKKSGTHLVLIEPTRIVGKIFEIVKLQIPVWPTLEAAVHDLRITKLSSHVLVHH